jgi:hypothetical protein
MKPIFARFFIVSAVTLSPALALAQSGQDGTIVGNVLDQTGLPLKGVKLTVRSETQIGGPRTGYSRDEGSFRFPGLQPGVFELRAEAPRLKPVIVKQVHVGVSTAAEVTVVMEVETATEEVSVIEAAPLVNTKSAAIRESLDLDMVMALPLDDRDNPHQGLLGTVAGAMGASNSQKARVRGGTSNQTIFTQDGFDMRDQMPTMKSSAAYEIMTGGHGGESPTASGAAVNLVTRSGSNRYEVEFNASIQHSALRFFLEDGESGDPNYKYVFNPTLSGPILKDKLWFFVNWDTNLDRDTRSVDPSGVFPARPAAFKMINKGTVKLTWQVTPRNKLTSLTNLDFPMEWNRKGEFGVNPEAQERRQARRWFTGLVWDSLLSDSLMFRSQAGLTWFGEHIFPELCVTDPGNCNFVHQVRQTFPDDQWWNNGSTNARNDTYDVQFYNRVEWFVPTPVLGEHVIALRSSFFTEQDIARASTPGDRIESYNGTLPLQEQVFFSNDPRPEDPRSGMEVYRYGWYIRNVVWYRHVASLTDSWRPTRFLTINPGISHIWGRAANSYGSQAIDATTFSPSLAVAWDATHDGRTVLRGSYSAYADVEVEALAEHVAGSRVSRTCKYNPDTSVPGEPPVYDKECTYSGGRNTNTIGLPCGPTGIDERGNPCKEDLKIPRTHEFTGGAERELVSGVALALDGIYRKYTNQYDVHETNRRWNVTGSGLERIGSFRNGRSQTINDLGTPDWAQRRYLGATAALRKREGRLRADISYTLSELKGADGAYGNNPGQDLFLYGYLDDDHRHEIRARSSLQMTSWLSGGFRYTYTSGLPYNRMYRNTVTGEFTDYRAPLGYSAGGDVNDPRDDRELRRPDLHSVNLQLRLNMRPILKQQLDFFVDVLNVFALRTSTGVTENDGPSFGRPTSSRMGPMRMRLGMNYRY